MTSLMTSPAVAMLLKVTLLMALGLLVASRIRSTAPELRHLLLFTTLASALALPFALVVLPRWEAPLLPSRVAPVIATTSLVQSADVFAPVIRYVDQKQVPRFSRDDDWSIADRARANPAAAFAVIWVGGSLVAMLMLFMGYLRLHRITQRAWPLELAEWSALLDDERARANVADDVALLVSPVASTPLTWGSHRAVILLPEDALDWPAEHRRVVLRHELAHIARKDAVAQLVAGVACGVYWFHPLVWIAARRLRAECERACDDRVLSSGTPAADYASHLLEVARSSRSLGGPGFLSVAMARPSQLEGRLLAILDDRRRIALTRRSRLLAVSFSALVVVAVSGFRAVPRDSSKPAIARGPVAVAAAAQTSSDAMVVTTSPVLAVAHAAISADTTFEKSVAVRSGETLTLDLETTGGALTIIGWDEPRVRVRGTLAGRGARDTQFKLESNNGGARLQTIFAGGTGDESFSHRFEIYVPRRFNVRIESAGGTISIVNVEGSFRGTTGGGSIEIERASGDVRLGTGGGDVRVSNSDLRGSVTTGGGAVRITNVTGGLVGSSGSGDVTINGRESGEGRSFGTGYGRGIGSSSPSTTTTYTARGDGQTFASSGFDGIQRRRSGGDIVLGEAPNGARVSTGGGTISIARSGGDVHANTGGGAIDIGPASGSVVASTGAGNISVAFAGGGAHSGEMTTGNGQIELVLPSDISATVILETAYTNNFSRKTRIESDWPVTVTESPDWDTSQGSPRKYVRSRLVLGSGEGVITVRAVNGNVVVKRAP